MCLFFLLKILRGLGIRLANNNRNALLQFFPFYIPAMQQSYKKEKTTPRLILFCLHYLNKNGDAALGLGWFTTPVGAHPMDPPS